MKTSKEELKEIMSPYQNQMAMLYAEAKGRVVIWKKGSQIRVLDPEEIFVYPEDEKSFPFSSKSVSNW